MFYRDFLLAVDDLIDVFEIQQVVNNQPAR